MSWYASFSTRSLWLALALLACDERDQAPATKPSAAAVRTAPGVQAPLDADVAAAPSGLAKSEPVTDASAPSSPGLPLSRDKLLLQLLEPDVTRWTYEAVRERFASLGLHRSEPLPGSLQWVLHTTREHLQFNYLPDEHGGFRFADVSFEMVSDSAGDATASYKKYAALLQKKLGKPTWVKDDPRYRARGYQLGPSLDVSLGAVATTGDSQPYIALSIAAAQNQGD